MTSGNDKSVTVPPDADLAGQLEQLTQATGENTSVISVATLSAYTEVEFWQMQDIEEAIAEADRGEFASASEVNSFFAKFR